MTTTSKAQLLAVTGLLFATIIWGGSFIFVKMTVAVMGLYYFLFLRFALSTLLMFAIFHRQIISTDKATIKASFILSLLLTTSFIAQTEGLRFTAAANSALITSLYMVFTPFICRIFQKTWIGTNQIIGVALSLAGMYLLTYYSLTGINIGDVITLVCALLFAWHLIFTGKYSVRHRLVPLVAYQFFFTAIFCAIAMLFQKEFSLNIPRIGIITLVITAIFATVIAFLIQTAAQRVLSPTRTGIICSMEAVFGSLIPWVIGFEMPTTISVLGACLMVAGMITSEIRTSQGRSESSLLP